MENPRILIIEEDRVIWQHLQTTLKQFGYEVLAVAQSSADAIQLAKSLKPDLALLDIDLEGGNSSIETAGIFQSQLNIPVVFLTSFIGNELLQQAKGANPFGFINRPFNEQILHATLELALQKHRFERELLAGQQRYRTVVLQSTDGIVLVDQVSFTILEANPAFGRMVGLSLSELSGSALQDVLQLANFEPELARLAGQKEIRLSAEPVQRPDGSLVYLEVMASLIESSLQSIICITTRNVTDQYLAEHRLRQIQEDLEVQVRQRTLALDQANHQLSALLNGIPDLAWVKDDHSRFIAVNQTLANACSSSVSGMIGKTDFDFFPSDLAESYRLDDLQVMETGRMKKIEEKFINKAGVETWIESIKVPVVNELGEVTGTAAIARDVTHRKVSEAVLQKSQAELADLVYQRTQDLEMLNSQLVQEVTERRRVEDSYRDIFENAVFGIYQATLDGRFTIINPAMARIFGYDTPGQMIEQVTDLATQVYVDPLRREQVLADALKAPGFCESENEYRRKDGTFFLGRVYFRAVRDARGVVHHLEGFIQDITERRRADQAIHESEERYRYVYNKTPVMLHSIDPQGRLISVSDYWLEVLGYTREEVLGLESTDLMTPASSTYAQTIVLPEFFRTGVCKDIPYQMVKKNGEVIDVLLSSVSERDAQGKITRSLSVMVDVTQRKRAEQQLQKQLRRMASLRAVEMSITARMDLHTTLDTLLEQVIGQLGVDAACVLLFNPTTQTLEDKADRGFHTDAIKSTRLRIGEGLAGQAARDRKLIRENNLTSQAGQINTDRYVPYLRPEGFVSYFGVPLIVEGQVKGVLEVYHRSLLNPALEWMEFLEAMARQAAIAIDNVTQFEEQQNANLKMNRSFDETIEGWARALELRDMMTSNHTDRVIDLTLKLALQVGYPIQEIDHLRRGSILHDIGKMGIPDRILNKEGALTQEEWKVMREHPNYAFEWLAPIDFLRPALDIPYCHHEHWDGSGYPRGLKGTQIPLSARIFTVADVYEALSTPRVYRPYAWQQDKIREYFDEQAGVMFDPKIVEVFLKMLEEGRV